MTRMQRILDAARANWKSGQAEDAFNNLVEAIELLSKHQQELEVRTVGSRMPSERREIL